jgi:hypothetical protein
MCHSEEDQALLQRNLNVGEHCFLSYLADVMKIFLERRCINGSVPTKPITLMAEAYFRRSIRD